MSMVVAREVAFFLYVSDLACAYTGSCTRSVFGGFRCVSPRAITTPYPIGACFFVYLHLSKGQHTKFRSTDAVIGAVNHMLHQSAVLKRFLRDSQPNTCSAFGSMDACMLVALWGLP